MITSNLKYILALGSLVATVFGVLRLIQDGTGGEAIAAITFNTGCLLFTGACVLQVIEDRCGLRRPPSNE